ncbi:MAG: hypothetical protein AB8G22_06645 [Saprospiraceae bacterium]
MIKSNLRSLGRVILINLGIFLILLIILNIFSSGILQLKEYINRKNVTHEQAPKSVKKEDFLGYTVDKLNLAIKYSAYVGWKRLPYNGEYCYWDAIHGGISGDKTKNSGEELRLDLRFY